MREHEIFSRAGSKRDYRVSSGRYHKRAANRPSLPRGLGIYRDGNSSRAALITLAQLEGRNSKRIIDRMARPVAAFQRFTASGTTSISLRQSLPARLLSCRQKAMTAQERALPALSASSWPKSKSSIADREWSDDQRTCGPSLIRGPLR